MLSVHGWREGRRATRKEKGPWVWEREGESPLSLGKHPIGVPLPELPARVLVPVARPGGDVGLRGFFAPFPGRNRT